MRARPERNAESIALDGVQALVQLVEIGYPCRAVRVDHQQSCAARVQHALLNGAALADIVGEGHDAHNLGRELARVRERALRGLVAAAVVDNDDLVREARIALLFRTARGIRNRYKGIV